MGKSKIVIYFESDVLSPMEILDTVLEELAMKRDDWATPMPLRCDPLIEVTDYEARAHRQTEDPKATRGASQ